MGQNREKIASDSIHPSKTTLTDTELFFLHYVGYYLHFKLASALGHKILKKFLIACLI